MNGNVLPCEVSYHSLSGTIRAIFGLFHLRIGFTRRNTKSMRVDETMPISFFRYELHVLERSIEEGTSERETFGLMQRFLHSSTCSSPFLCLTLDIATPILWDKCLGFLTRLYVYQLAGVNVLASLAGFFALRLQGVAVYKRV